MCSPYPNDKVTSERILRTEDHARKIVCNSTVAIDGKRNGLSTVERPSQRSILLGCPLEKVTREDDLAKNHPLSIEPCLAGRDTHRQWPWKAEPMRASHQGRLHPRSVARIVLSNQGGSAIRRASPVLVQRKSRGVRVSKLESARVLLPVETMLHPTSQRRFSRNIQFEIR